MNAMSWIEKELDILAGESLERTLTDTAASRSLPGHLIRGEETLLDLTSNDYLGLSRHPDIADSMRRALLEECGSGSTASRLLSGNRSPYRELEAELADWQRKEASLVFANGYMANLGTVSALVGRGDAVFSDRLNHASITDGILLSRAEHIRYRHNDMEHLEHMLRRSGKARRKLIVTDSVFSMDGDSAPLHKLVELKHNYGTMLMVDEAHAEGVYGTDGEGLCHAMNVHREVDVIMGTFSKAFGVYGAHVTGSRPLISLLVNKARPLVYTTALPPSIVAGIYRALGIVRTSHDRRRHLRELSGRFRQRLAQAGLNVVPGDSPIVPLIAGSSGVALCMSEALQRHGIAAPAIRPPTVPAGSARIRFSLSAAHTDAVLTKAAECIVSAAAEAGVLA
ncbi:8-amino-7-oxononanoate synthase [Paenibacillus sp. UNC499MF]|uniref:8-amino-7-oxononanoate synthase n=1 Tax=Paenibacillus sp. UNC499MF TaxID=1502751 RepID=UPI0008A04E64|nr:8-amino-7-oxononanoate synthase [Paenibacillus sp. UNC499MF]SEG46047.1 8-amino-7-oxononanoate synthase [Paenibacillus sp. UNC499MF]